VQADQKLALWPLSIFRLAVRLMGDNTPTKEAAMKYMLLIYSNGSGWDELSEDEQNAVFAEYMEIGQAPGVGPNDQLQPAAMATTVRVQGGNTLTTDGPFVETKEELGGYYLFEADDLDAAIELAARVPAARLGGAVEVRPVVER
jgi:hypothetical protein